VPFNKLLDKRGIEYTPGVYVVMRALLLFEVRFGATSVQQENEYRTLMQGNDTPENYAAKLVQLRQTLRHNKSITEKHLALRFLHGLQDRTCAESISKTLHGLSDSEYTIKYMLTLVQGYEQCQQLQRQIEIEQQVATSMTSQKPGKQQQLAGADGQQQQQISAKRLMQQLTALVVPALPKDHKDAPCVTHGLSHTNAQCRKQKQQQQQALPAGAASLSENRPANAVELIAAAMQALQGQAGGNRNNQRGRQQPAQQQQQGQPQAAPGANCNICERPGGHNGGRCWYDHPNRAPAYWAPSNRAPAQAIEHYRRRCNELGVQPKQPGERQQRPAAAGAAPGSSSCASSSSTVC
jgi:hypothetical protein